MREIKFRAWQKKAEQMMHWDELSEGYFRVSIFRYDASIFMQYTGLKDKNGKEIYEGDIFETEHYGKFVVEWDESDTGFYMRNPSYGDIDSLDADSHFSMGIAKEGEVVGNIYENPELLTRW